MNLRLRIVLALCAFGLLPGLLVLYTFRDLASLYSDETQAAIDVGARDLLDDIDYTLMQRRREIDTLAGELAPLAAHEDAVQRPLLLKHSLLAHLRDNASDDVIVFFDPQGNVLADVGLAEDSPFGKDAMANTTQPWFRRALAFLDTSLLLGPVHGLLPKRDGSPRAALVVARAVLASDGQTVGVIARLIDFKLVAEVVADNRTAWSTVHKHELNVAIVDGTGKLLYDDGVAADADIAQLLVSRRDGSDGHTSLGSDAPVVGVASSRIMHYRKARASIQSGWTVVVTTSHKSAFAAIESAARSIHFTLFVTMLLLGVAGMLLSRRLMQPIEATKDELKRLAAGDLAPANNAKTADNEFASVFAELDVLRARLADREVRESEIRRLNDELEQRVLERTAELKAETGRSRAGAQRFRDFVQAATEMLWETNADLRYTYMSEGCAPVIGVTPEALLGQVSNYLVPPPDTAADDPAWRVQRALVTARQPFHNFEVNFVGASGEQVVLQVSAVPTFDSEGIFRGYRGVGRDLSAQRQAEKERATAELRTRLVFESASDGILVCRDDGAIVDANRAIERMLGYAENGLVGRNVARLVFDTARLTPLAHTAASHTTDISEISARRADGSELRVDVSMSRGESHGLVLFTAVIRDASQRLHSEAQLIEAREHAEAAGRAKADFLANMSHEIRTPMNAVLGLAHLALKHNPPPETRDYLEKIHSAGSALLGIVNDILDFSKIEADKLALESVPFRLDQVVANVVSMVGLGLREKGLLLVVDNPATVPQDLEGDPLRVQQVLLNLMSNAIKFTHHGEVALRIRVLDTDGGVAHLEMSVTDTGIGLSAAHIRDLFQSFSQADTSHTRRYGGTGLGLAICKRLVGMMGGDIHCKSREGVGTTFRFDVRLTLAAEQRPTAVPAWLRALRVLVVDDHALCRQVVSDMLSALGCTADSAADARAALAMMRSAAARAPYDLVLMDWRMPDIDGLEATAIIRADAALAARSRIVMLTAFDDADLRERAARAGMDGFLLKPLSTEELRNSLLSLYGQHAPQTAGSGAAAPATAASVRGVRVLLVEDNEINRQIATSILSDAGALVETAANGRIAVDYLEARGAAAFDCVLMDIQMPEMDGYEATRRIRAWPAFAALPIIAMTAHAMAEARERAYAAGMNAHLIKPMDPNLLLATVARLTQRGAPGGDLSIAPVATPASVPEALPPLASIEIPGVDVGTALRRLGGRESLYLRTLDQFLSRGAQSADDIARSLAEAETVTAVRHAHTAKSVLGYVGAEHAQALAARLEKLLADSPQPAEVKTLLDEYRSELDMLVNHLTPVVKARLAS